MLSAAVTEYFLDSILILFSSRLFMREQNGVYVATAGNQFFVPVFHTNETMMTRRREHKKWILDTFPWCVQKW